MGMDFGMFTDFHVRPGTTQAGAFEESFNQVLAAEELGVDSVWLAEHHFSPDRAVLASPMVIASAIAARTSRVRIGLAVQVLPLTNPLRVAEEAATVDHISKGRFDFGIGRSGLTKYYHGYNVPYSESRGRFFEALEVIMTAWRQERFSYDGKFYSYGEVSLVPRPYQTPHPPTRVAVASADTFALMGSRGFPIFASASTPVPVLRERLGQYRRARAEAGHPGPGDVALRIPAYVAETAEKARAEPRASTEHGVRYAATELLSSAASEEGAERLRQAAATPYDELLKGRFLYGTPQAVTERLKEYQEELDISGVVLEMNYGGRIPYDRVVNSIRLLTGKVMPNFK
jgi:alkanesulfonate monooxygenase SsuD/methylene tetrahydromethanopterin reductase-like flavin-dependent oxidoreductase (luciferase family)